MTTKIEIIKEAMQQFNVEVGLTGFGALEWRTPYLKGIRRFTEAIEKQGISETEAQDLILQDLKTPVAG